MNPQTTALGSIQAVPVTGVAVRGEWMKVLAAFLVPALAAGAGGYLVLAAGARLLSVLFTPGVVH